MYINVGCTWNLHVITFCLHGLSDTEMYSYTKMPVWLYRNVLCTKIPVWIWLYTTSNTLHLRCFWLLIGIISIFYYLQNVCKFLKIKANAKNCTVKATGYKSTVQDLHKVKNHLSKKRIYIRNFIDAANKKYAQNIYTCIFGLFKPNFLNLCVDPVKLAHFHFIQVNTK